METPIEANVVSKKRCQLQIAKAWWEKKHAAINESISQQEEVRRFTSQLEEAKVEVEEYQKSKVSLQSSNKTFKVIE